MWRAVLGVNNDESHGAGPQFVCSCIVVAPALPGWKRNAFQCAEESWAEGKKSCHLVWETETALREVRILRHVKNYYTFGNSLSKDNFICRDQLHTFFSFVFNSYKWITLFISSVFLASAVQQTHWEDAEAVGVVTHSVSAAASRADWPRSKISCSQEHQPPTRKIS